MAKDRYSLILNVQIYLKLFYVDYKTKCILTTIYYLVLTGSLLSSRAISLDVSGSLFVVSFEFKWKEPASSIESTLC